jgi:hypothetical protein
MMFWKYKEIYNKEIFSEIKEGLMLVSCDGLLIDTTGLPGQSSEWLNEKNRGGSHSFSGFAVQRSTGAKNFDIGVGRGV